MTQSATVVGVASILNQTVRQDPVSNMIYTDYQVHFSDVWKGDPSEPFLVTKAGGTLNGQTASILGRDYVLQNGDTLVFFVHPSLSGSVNVVIGIRQGLYRVLAGQPPTVWRVSGPPPSAKVVPLTLPELKEQVVRALGKGLGSPSRLPRSEKGTSASSPAFPSDSPQAVSPIPPKIDPPAPRESSVPPAPESRMALTLGAVLGMVIVMGLIFYRARR
jgi:hypothetical protein